MFGPFSCPLNRRLNVHLAICFVFPALGVENFYLLVLHVLAASNRARNFRSVLKKL